MVGVVDKPEGFGITAHVRVVLLDQAPVGCLDGGAGGPPGQPQGLKGSQLAAIAATATATTTGGRGVGAAPGPGRGPALARLCLGVTGAGLAGSTCSGGACPGGVSPRGACP